MTKPTWKLLPGQRVAELYGIGDETVHAVVTKLDFRKECPTQVELCALAGRVRKDGSAWFVVEEADAARARTALSESGWDVVVLVTRDKMTSAARRNEQRRGPTIHHDHVLMAVPSGGRNFWDQVAAGSEDCPNGSVWRLKDEQGAPFPRALASGCLKATTSLKGACATCGKLWRRDTRPNQWVRTCRCRTEAVTRSVVLDPWPGAGQTGAAALAYGCDWTGIEPNAKKAETVETALRAAESVLSAPLFEQREIFPR